MQPVDRRVVDLLNDALTFELTVTNTYFLHARMLDNWGFPRLGKVFYDLSIDEMRDADSLINRILFFDGHPNVQKLGAITVGEDAEEILRLALASEVAAVAQFNTAAKECHALGDHGTASIFEAMVLDEEKHADWFETQLDAIVRIGLPQYLAQQVDAGTAPSPS
ncbi:MAG: bacterioferritin [Dermatophilaceae bacterium]